MHGALRELGGFEIDVRWELMQRDAFGNDTFEELMAIKEEEDIAKELRLKEHKLLQEKQGYLANGAMAKNWITAAGEASKTQTFLLRILLQFFQWQW